MRIYLCQQTTEVWKVYGGKEISREFYNAVVVKNIPNGKM